MKDKKKMYVIAVVVGAVAGVMAWKKKSKKEKQEKEPTVPHRQGFYEKYFKRLVDILCGIAAIVAFWWLYLLVAILVKVKLGSPIIFAQERPGKDEKIFKLYKFRTMTDERDEDGNLLPDMIRLTKFGKFLRDFSLDELPEVVNILKGDMSVIGPRPLLVKYLPLYNEKQRRRHEVRPGMSGYAQAHGRNSMTWEEKFDMDVYYVDHITFWGDVKIVIDTVLSVIKREGIDSAETSTVTMEEFKGTIEE